MSSPETIKFDVCVIGTGAAGFAAALYAANRGLSTVQVGSTGEIVFSSGLLDLLGVHPVEEKHRWKDPWTGLEALVRDIPNHPYAKLEKEEIQTAFEELLTDLAKGGLSYSRNINRNASLLTSLGTIKTTYAVPQTMWAGVEALREKLPCLIIDIQGLKGFSARQIASSFKTEWPALRTARISFPDMGHLSEVHAEHMANTLVLKQNREKLAQAVKPCVKDEAIVGLPAILGLYRANEVVEDLNQLIGVPVFEIPTIPPSVPGLRLKETFERLLRTKGVTYFSQKRVLEICHQVNDEFELSIGSLNGEHTVKCRGVILASGRFIGGGLHADRRRIRETIFDLPVYQPGNRTQWHCRDFLDSRGHPVNQAGLEVDDIFRPLDQSGRPAFPTLFAAGSILAHQDWKRQKCGSGLALATAFGAVKSFIRTIH